MWCFFPSSFTLLSSPLPPLSTPWVSSPLDRPGSWGLQGFCVSMAGKMRRKKSDKVGGWRAEWERRARACLHRRERRNERGSWEEGGGTPGILVCPAALWMDTLIQFLFLFSPFLLFSALIMLWLHSVHTQSTENTSLQQWRVYSDRLFRPQIRNTTPDTPLTVSQLCVAQTHTHAHAPAHI